MPGGTPRLGRNWPPGVCCLSAQLGAEEWGGGVAVRQCFRLLSNTPADPDWLCHPSARARTRSGREGRGIDRARGHRQFRGIGIRFAEVAAASDHLGFGMNRIRLISSEPTFSAPIFQSSYPRMKVATGMAKGPPGSWALLPLRFLQQRVLRAFAFGEQRQRFACDIGLEMRALLMRLEGGFVTKQFVEQELCGIFFRSGNQKQLCAGFALRLRQEARQNIGDPVGLSFPGFPLRDDQQSAALDGPRGWFSR